MEQPVHSLNALFDQLGLASSESDIQSFIEKHSPIPDKTLLHEASCWTTSQATLLKELIEEDADWAEVVDEFDARMRA